MTNGERSGTSGIFLRSLPLFAVTIIALNIVNTLTAIQDSPEISWIYFVVFEATSAATSITFLWICWVAYKIAPIDRPPVWRVLGVHAVGLLVFGTFHIGGFFLLRHFIFGWLDMPYDVHPLSRFIYELRKDALGYAIGTAAFWGMIRIYGQTPAVTSLPDTFDIRDGARMVRVNLADVLGVTSAGNYVEFILADGRRPLMRSPLSAIEAELAPRGFVRTHRSWLVNAARVTELRPEKSGDYAVGLGEVEAPLSRRFPDALARLRGG